MNNAANNIDATSKTLKGLLKERRYKVGYFQREYKWKKNHIEDLIDDLERSFFLNFHEDHTQENVADYDCYYMGPVVLYREGSTFSIVDGQQRLTSFTLLLIYLNHVQAKIYSDAPKKVQKLDEYIFSQSFGKETFNLDIDERKDILDKLFSSQDIEAETLTNESCINIYERYKDIEELFPKRLLLKEVLALFVNWITEKLVFIEIVAQSSDSAYTIFETMNDRGLNLTPSEMLKSYLLASINDDPKINELDIAWKAKIGLLKAYAAEEDQDFFRAWLRARYAETIRSTHSGAENEDFEKIGTRFHTWVKENNRKLLLRTPNDFYFLVQSDFQFYSDVYLRLCELEVGDKIPEHKFKLLSYKGIANSLAYPLLLSPIEKVDEDEVVEEKINLVVDYLDAFAVYRLLMNLAITQSTVRNGIYLLIKEIRKASVAELRKILSSQVTELRKQFTKTITYIPYDRTYSKYLLSRLYKERNPNLYFEDIYFQRRKDSFIPYQFLTNSDVESEVHKIPKGLKDIFVISLTSYVIVPKSIAEKLDKMKIVQRIQYLIKEKYIFELSGPFEFDSENLKDFFMKRNKALKDLIIDSWKIV